MDNPNALDLDDPQVMSRPNDSYAHSRSGQPSGQVVNGVDRPLRGRLDLDDEVTTNRSDLELGAAASDRLPPDVQQRLGGAVPPVSPSDFLQGPGVVAKAVGPGTSSQGEQPSVREEGSGVLPGVGRAFQALPTAAEEVTGGRVSNPGSTGAVRAGDSVEYASVASSVARRESVLQPHVEQVPETPLLDSNTMRRLQQLHSSAPQLYGHSPETIPPRPPSTTSSDIQMEVRRQLNEVMNLHEEESRRLRAQVEALVAENYELRMNSLNDVQGRQATSRPWLVTQGGFPGLGWLGRGLGSIIGGSPPPPPQPMDLRAATPPQHNPGLGGASRALELTPIPPPPPPPVPYAEPKVHGPTLSAMALPVGVPKAAHPKTSGLDPYRPAEFPNPQAELGVGGLPAEISEGNEVGAYAQSLTPFPAVEQAPKGSQGLSSGDNPLDPLSVVLTGMAQLQGLVTEMATTTKGAGKPELVKPGSVALPELPPPGPEGCLLFADWLHDSKPALADISDTSETLWRIVLEESERWYKGYLMLGPMDRLVSKPTPPASLQDPKWSRVSRRIESMIITAAPTAVRQELSAARISGLLNVVSRLFCIYGPGGLAERELGLKHIQEPPTAGSVQEVIDGLRRWRRWCHRTTELGGALPDCAIRVRALTKLTRQVLPQHPEISFRISLVRAELQVDLTPTDDKVEKLHGQLLSEFEAVHNRKDRDIDRDKGVAPTPPAKVKGVEATEALPTIPKAPKPPKSNAKTQPAHPKGGTPGEGAGQGKPPCSFYASPTGCKKGLECSFEHDWSSIPQSERSQRCKSCGARGHRAAECKAGTKDPSPKAKGKGQGKAGVFPKAGGLSDIPPPPPPSVSDAQQIKSMLADAALILQQANPANSASSTEVPQATPQAKAGPQAQDATGGSPSGITQGTPVTLASLNAQLETLKSMTRDFGVRMVHPTPISPRIAAVALLDSGATHAVIPFNANLQDLDTVPVTLAGDSREEWWKTRGGTLVVPPQGQRSSSPKDLQMILPLGALVETLGCKVSWSRRSGLKVVHPSLGVLRTGVGRNTCPFLQEDQALRLISELEEKRLSEFEQEVESFQYHLESLDKPVNPTDALRTFAITGTRQDALRAVMAQPFFAEAREDIRARLAESIPGRDDCSGREVLKALPLNRASRRELLASTRWVVHLCSGEAQVNDPLVAWAEEQGARLVRIDLQAKGGKGWDLSQPYGVWRALLWAASAGRIVAILSSPPPVTDETKLVLNLQPMFLWSLASITRGKGIPYLFEHALVQDKVPQLFAQWSAGQCQVVGQGSDALRLITNLDLGYVEDVEVSGRVWSPSLKDAIARALSGRPRCQSVELLDQVISKGLKASSILNGHQEVEEGICDEAERLTRMFEQYSDISSSEEEGNCVVPPEPFVRPQEPDLPRVSEVKELSQAAKDGWKRHLLNGHTPYRRDCRFCVEGAGLGVFHHKIKYPRSFALSIDLFGPVPVSEAGRDETCVTGKCNLRYGLVGAFRIPKASFESDPKLDGVQDLFKPSDHKVVPLPSDVDCEEYEPSEPAGELFPELFGPDRGADPNSDDGTGAVQVEAVTMEGESVSLEEGSPDLPQDEEGLAALIDELRAPVEQTVLRYFIPLRTKTGPEVTEAVQKMILEISKDFPVRCLHHDPGTEFSSTTLSRWLANKGVRVQHSLPTDKRGNGLAERSVGWVKERIRTLLKGASLPIHWWPIAARWAVHKHNVQVFGKPLPPAFGQKVLHRVKRPADGAKQLMERWVEALYGAPHRSVQGGHILITPAGGLVASRGFKSEILDPNEIGDLELPILREEEGALLMPSDMPEDSNSKPEVPGHRLRMKSKVRFIEFDEDSVDVEEWAGRFLLEDDCSDRALRKVVQLLGSCEKPSGDRRGDLHEKFVFGAFCHGGQRGVTSIAKRRPQVTRFLNHFLRRRLVGQYDGEPPEWSAVMTMQATEVEEHKDVRNEWGSYNYALCVHGGLELQIKAGKDHEPRVLPLDGRVVRFDARNPHLVRRRRDWFVIGFTPLGTRKLSDGDRQLLGELGFRTPDSFPGEPKIRMVDAGDLEGNGSSEGSSPLSSSLPSLESIPVDLEQPSTVSQDPECHALGILEQDVQQDSETPLIGWDPSQGEGHNYPVQNLEETDLQQFLDERGVGWTFRRLTTLGVLQASDLAFLFQEDLVEFGIPPQDARRIMIGVHPSGTVRPDNPNLSSLTTGEVRLFDRQQRQIPRVIQNRTLELKSPGPPVTGLGVRDPVLGYEDPDEDWIVSEERRRNEERWIAYTNLPNRSASSTQPPLPSCAESADFPSAQVEGVEGLLEGDSFPYPDNLWFEDYEGYAEHAMAMQAVWDEDEDNPDIGQGCTSASFILVSMFHVYLRVQSRRISHQHRSTAQTRALTVCHQRGQVQV